VRAGDGAPVDGQQNAGDVSTIRAGQEHGGAGDVPGVAFDPQAGFLREVELSRIPAVLEDRIVELWRGDGPR